MRDMHGSAKPGGLVHLSSLTHPHVTTEMIRNTSGPTSLVSSERSSMFQNLVV